MRSSILITVLALPLLAATASAHPCIALSGDAYGFPSEDMSGQSYLGVDSRDITPDRLGALHLKEEHGVEITLVDQDAPAGKAGLREHDVILSLNGAPVESVEQLRRMIRETPPGRVVTLGLSRNGDPLTIKVQLADRKDSFAYSFSPKAKEFHFEMPAIPPIPDIDIPVSIVVVHSSMRSGLMVENLTPQLGDFFGTKNGQGVLVRSVEKGSRADKAGFRAGDVIIKINGEPIHDSGDFSHALRGRKDNTVSIGILRDKREQTITFALPEHKQSEFYRESLEVPEMDAETRKELSQMQREIARMKPEMTEAVNHQLELAKPEIERQTRELRQHAEELKKAMREMRRQLRSQQWDMERELREEMRQNSEF